MTHTSRNQNRSRKYGGTSSFVDAGQPSQAPRQDEDADTGSTPANPGVGAADTESSKQGISNRPAKEEHAFPEPHRSADSSTTSVDDPSKQQGGARSRV